MINDNDKSFKLLLIHVFFLHVLFFAMSLSAGGRPKRNSKKVLDPDFQYKFPSSAFLQDDLNLEEQSNPSTCN